MTEFENRYGIVPYGKLNVNSVKQSPEFQKLIAKFPELRSILSKGVPRGTDYWLERLERQLFEAQQSRLFESLVPSFAEVPIKRVFPLAVFVAGDRDLGHYGLAILTDGFGGLLGERLLGEYPDLHGSSLSRFIYETSKHQTLDEFQISQRQLAEELILVLREHDVQNITINLYPPSPKAEPKEWAGKFKDVSEALKNLLLVGAGCTILLGGTLVSSKHETPEKPPSVTVKQIAPKDQIELLPKILEATTPEDFEKAVSEVPHAATPKTKPKRKSR